MAGKFSEAETFFLNAHKANPELLGGSDLQKAAYARWLSGDLAGADKVFEDYLKYRVDHADQTVAWRRAVWEYSTGRESAAIERLKTVTGPAMQLAQGQLLVFSNRSKLETQDLVALERIYRQTAPGADGMVRTLYARGLLKAGRKAEAEGLAGIWPLPESGEPLLQALLYPMYLELQKELGK
jgi:hypothetical protein